MPFGLSHLLRSVLLLLKIRRHYYSVHTVYTEYNIVYSVEYILTLVFSQPPLPDKFRAPKVGRVFTKLELIVFKMFDLKRQFHKKYKAEQKGIEWVLTFTVMWGSAYVVMRIRILDPRQPPWHTDSDPGSNKLA